MTEPPLDEDLVNSLLAVGTAITCYETAAVELDGAPLDDEDVATIRRMPMGTKLKIVARLIEVADSIRADLRNLDLAVLALTTADVAAELPE